MAKVKVFNHTERKIHINLPHTAKDNDGNAVIPQEPYIVPQGKMDDESKKIIPGEMLIEEDHLNAVKNHPVIRHYFTEGDLRLEKKAQPAPQQPAGGNQGQGGGTKPQNQQGGSQK